MTGITRGCVGAALLALVLGCQEGNSNSNEEPKGKTAVVGAVPLEGLLGFEQRLLQIPPSESFPVPRGIELVDETIKISPAGPDPNKYRVEGGETFGFSIDFQSYGLSDFTPQGIINRPLTAKVEMLYQGEERLLFSETETFPRKGTLRISLEIDERIPTGKATLRYTLLEPQSGVSDVQEIELEVVRNIRLSNLALKLEGKEVDSVQQGSALDLTAEVNFVGIKEEDLIQEVRVYYLGETRTLASAPRSTPSLPVMINSQIPEGRVLLEYLVRDPRTGTSSSLTREIEVRKGNFLEINSVQLCEKIKGEECINPLTDLSGGGRKVYLLVKGNFHQEGLRRLILAGNYELVDLQGKVIRSGRLNYEKRNPPDTEVFSTSQRVSLDDSLPFGELLLRVMLQTPDGRLNDREEMQLQRRGLRIRDFRVCKPDDFREGVCKRGQTRISDNINELFYSYFVESFPERITNIATVIKCDSERTEIYDERLSDLGLVSRKILLYNLANPLSCVLDASAVTEAGRNISKRGGFSIRSPITFELTDFAFCSRVAPAPECSCYNRKEERSYRSGSHPEAFSFSLRSNNYTRAEDPHLRGYFSLRNPSGRVVNKGEFDCHRGYSPYEYRTTFSLCGPLFQSSQNYYEWEGGTYILEVFVENPAIDRNLRFERSFNLEASRHPDVHRAVRDAFGLGR